MLPPLLFYPFLQDCLKSSKFSFTAMKSQKLWACCPRTLTLISIYSDSLYMALCVSPSESVNASFRCLRQKKDPRPLMKLKRHLQPLCKLPQAGGKHCSPLHPPPSSSSFLRRHFNGWLQKKIIARLNNCKSIIRAMQMLGNLHFFCQPHQGVMTH